MTKSKLGVSYFGVRNPEYVGLDMRRMVEAGCNVVLHTFSEEDLRFYPETMREIVALSKQYGLEVHLDPWGVGGVFGGEAFTQFALEHDEARQILSDGRKAPAACPNHPEFRKFMKFWVRTAVELGADAVFFDEPHFWDPRFLGFPSDVWACRCENCQDAFQRMVGKPLPKNFTPEIREFQELSLRSFLAELAQEAKSGGAKVALCLLPDWEEKNTVLERWARFAQLPSVDIFGTDPYWMWAERSFSDFEFFVRVTVELGERFGKEPQIWIQACKVKKGQEEWVRKSVERAWELGVRNIMAWSFLGTPYITWVRSDRPERVWEELVAAFQMIRMREGHALV